jgi:hypothetical protein
MNKTEFLRELTTKRAEWDAILAAIPHDQMLMPGVNEDQWTVKDIVAHVAWYENEMMYPLKYNSLNSANVNLWNTPQDERNAIIFEQNRNLTLDEVLDWEQSTYNAVLQEAQKLTDEDLNDPSRHEGMPADWKPWEVLASNTYEHYADHTAELKSWLAKSNS